MYSVDRFSRSGANAIYITSQLKKEGVVVYAVTQPSDASTSSGTLQQNMQFIFSEYENNQRKEKCMAGVREKLDAGIWCTGVPTGYDIVRSEGQPKRIVLNAKGKLIRYAFELKATGLTSEDVRRQVAAKGLKLSNQRISAILRNPFYCGLIVHKALQGKVKNGIQEKAVSRELFLKVNGILAERHKVGYTTKPENEDVPLKRFLKCDKCGQFLRAYKASKNQQYYYKCNTIGCCCNKRASELHKAFEQMLSQYVFNVEHEGIRYAIRRQIIATYNQLTQESEEHREHVRQELEQVIMKLDRLEERFVMEEITREMFDKYAGKLREERLELETSIQKVPNVRSNLESCIEKAINLSSKLSTVWHLSDYQGKHELQFLLFPDGMYYCRKTDGCRTPKINEVFFHIASLQRLFGGKEKRDIQDNLNVPSWVARSGIEPETFGL